MRQLICRRTCEWLEIGYTYRAVRISYLLRLTEVAHIHIGYCKITTCYRARPDKRAQRCSVSSSSRKSILLFGLPTFKVSATITDKLQGVVSRYIIMHCNKYVEKHQHVVQKSTCAHLKLTGKHAFR